jgi:hypothetical protein
MIDHEPDERAKSHFRWKAALWAGLGVGGVFIFLSKGVPWGSMGFAIAAMGREILIREVPTLFVVNILLHLVLSVLYAFVIGRVVYRFNIAAAVGMGGLIGLALYGVNFFIFDSLGLSSQREAPVAVTHLFFGLVCAAAYKAFSVPKLRHPRVA